MFKTSYGRFVDVVGHGEKSERHRTRKKSFELLKIFIPRTTMGGTRGKHVQHTRSTRSAFCHGQSTAIGRVLRVGIAGNSVCLAAYHCQMDVFLALHVAGRD